MTARSFSTRAFLLSVCLTLAPAHPATAAGNSDTSTAKSNLDLMQSLLGRITQEVIGIAHLRPGDTINFRMRPAEDGWIAENSITSALRASGCLVFVRPDSVQYTGYNVQVLSAALHVQYTGMYRDGFLGTRKLRRTVSAQVTCDVLSADSRELLYSGSPARLSADTVLVDSIVNLELPSAKTTHAELPAENFLDRVLEPVVIIGATGVSIYLFFHVRS